MQGIFVKILTTQDKRHVIKLPHLLVYFKITNTVNKNHYSWKIIFVTVLLSFSNNHFFFNFHCKIMATFFIQHYIFHVNINTRIICNHHFFPHENKDFFAIKNYQKYFFLEIFSSLPTMMLMSLASAFS